MTKKRKPWDQNINWYWVATRMSVGVIALVVIAFVAIFFRNYHSDGVVVAELRTVSADDDDSTVVAEAEEPGDYVEVGDAYCAIVSPKTEHQTGGVALAQCYFIGGTSHTWCHWNAWEDGGIYPTVCQRRVYLTGSRAESEPSQEALATQDSDGTTNASQSAPRGFRGW